MNPIITSDLYSVFAFGKNNLKRFSRPIVAYAYFKNKRINLISSQEEKYSLLQLEARFNDFNLKQNFTLPIVFHLTYELGYLFVGEKDRIDGDQLLAIELVFQKVEDYQPSTKEKLNIKNLHEPLWEEYSNAFEKGYDHLIEGNCYQLNLTSPFYYKVTTANLDSLINHFWKMQPSAYGHGTYIPSLGKTFFSNSPECLFQMKRLKKGFKLWTMPIKGTIPFDGNSFRQKWNELSICLKNRAELDMITDLLRNDLSSIEDPVAKVIFRNHPLMVPSILHQFSLISVDLSEDVSFGQILKAIFPGGSVTGAPKKRVMQILSELEERPRGFYCGSTVLFYGDILAASINIRSMELDHVEDLLTYQAGGGITLKSNCRDEFEEMYLKTAQLSI